MPASSTLGGDAVGAAPPAATNAIAPRGCPVSRAVARAGFFGPTRARWAGSQAPLSRPVHSLGIPSSLPERPAYCPCRPPRPHTFRRPEVPSAGRSHSPCPRLAPETRLPGRHWYPDFAAMGPASDLLSRPAPPNARPKPLAGFHRSAWATSRLPTSAAECPPSTPPSRPNPVADCSGKPLREQVTAPLAELHQPSCLRPGVSLAFGPFRPPPRRPLAAVDLPQPD